MVKLKPFFRKILCRTLFSRCEPIVIASTGRSGSTLIFNTVAEGFTRARFRRLGRVPLLGERLESLSKCFIDRLSDIDEASAPIMKTHALYRDKYRDKAKYLFVYGPPLDSAVSVRDVAKREGEEWFRNHLYHLESEGSLDQLFTEDILRYEDQLASWGGSDNWNILCVHYTELWEREAEISAFLGFKVTLPEQRARSAKTEPVRYDAELFDRLAIMENNLSQGSLAQNEVSTHH